MPWTAKWIAAIVGTFVLLVIADRIWFVQEMKTLADKLGVGWSKIERRGTFPYEYYKKVVHYGMTKDEVHNIMAYYASVEEKQYGRYLRNLLLSLRHLEPPRCPGRIRPVGAGSQGGRRAARPAAGPLPIDA